MWPPAPVALAAAGTGTDWHPARSRQATTVASRHWHSATRQQQLAGQRASGEHTRSTGAATPPTRRAAAEHPQKLGVHPGGVELAGTPSQRQQQAAAARCQQLRSSLARAASRDGGGAGQSATTFSGYVV